MWRRVCVGVSRACARGGSLLLVGASASASASARLMPTVPTQDHGTHDLAEAKPMELNEAAALTHTSLLKQASGAAVDSSLQLLHRTVRATLDFSQQYRKQLNELIGLMEECTAVFCNPEMHDLLWAQVVVARSKADSLKQQIKDLGLLLTYACAAVENTAMAAFMSGAVFSATSAQQVTDSARLEIKTDSEESEAVERQYLHTQTQYIEATQRELERMKSQQGDDSGMEENQGEDEGMVDR